MFSLSISIGIVFFDCPFGLSRESWDTQAFPAEDWAAIIQRLKAINPIQCCRFILQHLLGKEVDYGDAMVRAAGLKALTYWFWIKPGQNQANVGTVSSVEILTVASQSNPPPEADGLEPPCRSMGQPPQPL